MTALAFPWLGSASFPKTSVPHLTYPAASIFTNSILQRYSFHSPTKTNSDHSAQNPNWHHAQTIHGSVTTSIVKNATTPALTKQRSATRSLDYPFQSRENAGRIAGHRIVNAFRGGRNCIRDWGLGSRRAWIIADNAICLHEGKRRIMVAVCQFYFVILCTSDED